jgi:hypothetical protein
MVESTMGTANTHGGGGGGSSGSGAVTARSLATLQSITQPSSESLTSSLLPPSPLPLSPMDAGIGRIYQPQRRRDCWESPRLYCPDYCWADDAIGGCQRLLKNLSKHRFVTLVNNHGLERYYSSKEGVVPSGNGNAVKKERQSSILYAPTYASNTPHVFPSLEAVHSLQYLVFELLFTSIPSRINQFRAATESNAVVSKRLYLVKCEYRAPMRALWESCMNLNAAPKAELVERYLREYHGVKVGEGRCMENGGGCGGGGVGGIISEGEVKGSGKGLSGRKKSTLDSTEVMKKSGLQQQREKLEVREREQHLVLFLSRFSASYIPIILPTFTLQRNLSRRNIGNTPPLWKHCNWRDVANKWRWKCLKRYYRLPT